MLSGPSTPQSGRSSSPSADTRSNPTPEGKAKRSVEPPEVIEQQQLLQRISPRAAPEASTKPLQQRDTPPTASKTTRSTSPDDVLTPLNLQQKVQQRSLTSGQNAVEDVMALETGPTSAADGEPLSDDEEAASSLSDPTRALMERLMGGGAATNPFSTGKETDSRGPSSTTTSERGDGEGSGWLFTPPRLPWENTENPTQTEDGGAPSAASGGKEPSPPALAMPQIPSITLPELPQLPESLLPSFSLPSPSELASATGEAIGSAASDLANSASSTVSQAADQAFTSASDSLSRAADGLLGDRTALAIGVVAVGALAAGAALVLTQVGLDLHLLFIMLSICMYTVV